MLIFSFLDRLWLIGTNLDELLTGAEGKDTLQGFAGNDTLDGGAGADQMWGGEGDDVYFVDSVSDQVIEHRNQGYDIVFASVDFNVQGSSIEEVRLVGTAKKATGGNFDDKLIGNDSDNILLGNWGKDTLIGGAGNDTLNGGGDADTLTGGTGADTFILEKARFYHLQYRAVDIITDFVSGEDKIQFPARNFSFATVASDCLAEFSQATVVYSLGSATLFYNPNGAAIGFDFRSGRFPNVINEYGGAIAYLNAAPQASDILV
jgi:Ca2+-binding RTX toxin-like protein